MYGVAQTNDDIDRASSLPVFAELDAKRDLLRTRFLLATEVTVVVTACYLAAFIMLGGYSRLDLNADWHPNERLSIGLAVDNVFDKRYSESVGFLTPGIQPRLSLRYAF